MARCPEWDCEIWGHDIDPYYRDDLILGLDRIDLVDPDGARRSIYRRVNGGGGFGRNPLRQTIGLGRPAAIEQVAVYWPTTDRSQSFADPEPDRLYRIVEASDELELLDPRP